MKKTFTLFAALVLCLSGQVLMAQANPELLYYKFDGTGTSVPNQALTPPPGTTTATIMGGVTQGAGGLCGGALIGSGNASSSDYLNTGYAPNLSGTSWTISMYTKDISASATLFYIFGDANSGSFRCFTNGVAGPNNWVLRGSGITDVYINGGATVAAHLTTFVYDITTNTIYGYLDGVLVTSVAQPGPVISGAGPFKVMGYATNVGAPAGGKLDEFRMYNRALNTAEVMQLMTPHTTGMIAPITCGNYLSPDNHTYSSTGTYTDTIPNVAGCDSIITINLTVNQPSSSTMIVNTCGSYTAPSGAVYTLSGNYMDTIPNSVGCDSVIALDVTIRMPSTFTFSASGCDSYILPSGASVSSSGMYMDTIPNMVGCDSVMTINVTVNLSTTSSISPVACDSFIAPSGAVYNMPGSYVDVIPNVAGCDSTININLSIINSSTSTMSLSSCDSVTAPSGAVYTTSGTYTDVIPNAAGCDSIITISVAITNSTMATMTISSCDSVIAPSGAVYTTSGTYMDVIPNAAGCDSIITVIATVSMPSSSTMSVTSCGAYTAPSGATLTTSGTYSDYIPNAAGCDSVITINLQVNTLNVSVSQASGTLTSAATGVSYQWIDCTNNAPVAGANAQSFTATVSGSYAVVVSDSTCTDTSSCFGVTVIGVEEQAFASVVAVYPNPNSGQFTLDLGASYSNVTVIVTDLAGRVVFAKDVRDAQLVPVELDAAAGVYTVQVVAGNSSAVLRVVKE